MEDSPIKRRKLGDITNKSHKSLKRRSEDDQEAQISKKPKLTKAKPKTSSKKPKVVNKSSDEQAHEPKSKLVSQSSKEKAHEIQEEDDHHLDYFSYLPNELLLKIVEEGESSMLSMSGTCRRFNKICGNRLALCVDFDRIFWDEFLVYPSFVRAYTDIKLIGDRIDDEIHLITNMLQNSRESLIRLTIGSSFLATTISINTLRAIIRYFPNLMEIKKDIYLITSSPERSGYVRTDFQTVLLEREAL